MDAAFEVCFTRIMKAEGGYVDHPLDRGGPTKFGITLKSLMSFRKKVQTAEDVKKLTENDARLFYRETFWIPLRLREIGNTGLAVLLLDQAVNRGPRTAIMSAQIAMKSVGSFAGECDGLIGDHTISSLNKVNFKQFGMAYFKTLQEGYVKICQNDPKQLVFMMGWLRRTHDLLDQVIV